MIEDDCYFLGVHMRLSTRCKILFTLGLFANYFSLKSLSLSLKSHMNVLCPLKLTELWNTSLLFDLNYKYIVGASLLALVKSIYYYYYYYYYYLINRFIIWCNWSKMIIRVDKCSTFGIRKLCTKICPIFTQTVDQWSSNSLCGNE